MKSINPIIAIFTSISLSLFSAIAFAQETTEDVHLEVNSWVRMWNTFNFQEVDRLFIQSDRLSYFSSERDGLILGIEAVRDHYKSFGFVDGGSHPLTKLWLEEVSIQPYDSAALVTGIWYFQRTDGRLQKGPVTIFYTVQNGDYKIAHMNFSNYDSEQLPATFQAVSLLGEILEGSAPDGKSKDNLRKALSNYETDPNNLEHIIWYGRRMAYTGDYRQAIDIYTAGIKLHPKEPRLYRHRGHRLISIREFDAAIRDFETAMDLIQNTTDTVEQDGLPNPANIPTSTLHGNIRYHLGLAYYLAGKYEDALAIYRADLAAGGSDDFLVATTHWLYMTLLQLDRTTEAEEALSQITNEMNILESQDYHDLCLFYKGKLNINDIMPTNDEGMTAGGKLYGIANWYAHHDQKDKAKALFHKITSGDGWSSFGYIAAEAELAKDTN